MSIALFFSLIGLLLLCAALEPALRRRAAHTVPFTVRVLWLAAPLWAGFWLYGGLSAPAAAWGFKVDALAALMVLLILFISAVVHTFSCRYMAGDRLYGAFFGSLTLLTTTALGCAAAANVASLGACWILNQLLLSRLMVHKAEWHAARQGGRLYLLSALGGSACLLVGLGLLASATGSFALADIGQQAGDIPYGYKAAAFLLILLAALAQSGLWPLHRWLISSLNSPTPVSAFMHAGLVNGGGLLLARLAPLTLDDALFSALLMALGLVSLTIGTVWKLMQSSVKKMLACSTMAQMGFMFVQCGLGLFPAAMAHICWHGLFKAFLFLNAGSAIASPGRSSRTLHWLCYPYALLAGGGGAAAFGWGATLSPFTFDTRAALALFAAIACLHVSLASLRAAGRAGLVLAPLSSLLFGTLYGTVVHSIELLLRPMALWSPRPLTTIDIMVLLAVVSLALAINFMPARWQESRLWKRIYVRMLNRSQSQPHTITSHRHQYQF